jgi:flagellar motor switch protein FliN/FliY
VAKDSLSKEEIDALLQEDTLSQNDVNVLVEILRLPIQSSGQVLAESIGCRLDWELGQVYPLEEINLFELVGEWVQIELKRSREQSGDVVFLLEPDLAKVIASITDSSDEGHTLTAEQLQQVNKAFKGALAAFNHQLSELLDERISLDVLKTGLISKENQPELLSIAGPDSMAVQIVSQSNDHVHQGFIILSGELANELIYFTNKPDVESVPVSAEPKEEKVMPEEPEVKTPAKKVKTVEFEAIKPQPVNGSQGNMGLLLDVPMRITVELGRAEMQLREVLALSKGQVIQLDKLAGEPVDVYVNGKLIAKGEVVVMDENFGVKITNIITPQERMENLH